MLHSINESAKLLGMGRTTIYRLLREKKLEFLKIGRRTLIPYASLERFVALGRDEGV